MRRARSKFGSAIGAGIAAGLAGTCVMMAMRKFDEKYAPMTIAKMTNDPGRFAVNAASGSAAVPKAIECSAVVAARMGYGALFGALYSLWRGRGAKRSALLDGVLLGGAVYAAGYLGWLPALGFSKPVWKQKFPQIAGELLRHVAYGVATSASFGTIDEVA